MKRKDKFSNHILEANSTICNAASRFSKVKLMRCFHPTDEMFYDSIHLNTFSGIPAIVKHIQSELHITPQNDPPRPKFRPPLSRLDNPPQFMHNQSVAPPFTGNPPMLHYPPMQRYPPMPRYPPRPPPLTPPRQPMPPPPPLHNSMMPPVPYYFNPWAWNPYC